MKKLFRTDIETAQWKIEELLLQVELDLNKYLENCSSTDSSSMNKVRTKILQNLHIFDSVMKDKELIKDAYICSSMLNQDMVKWFQILCNSFKMWISDTSMIIILLQILEWINDVSVAKYSIEDIKTSKILYLMKEAIYF